MQQFIRASEISLGDFLTLDKPFVMPANQRNFGWGKKEYESYWSDLWHTLTNDCPFYFLGSFVLDASEDEALIVVDGQQRLTTTSILIAALRNILSERGDPELAQELHNKYLYYANSEHNTRLTMNFLDNDFYLEHVMKTHSPETIKALTKDRTIPESNRNIAICLDFMYRKLSAEGNRKETPPLGEIARTIINIMEERIGLIHITVKGDVNAFTVFETLNDRGLELNAADLLKNHLLSVQGVKTKECAKNWDNMTANLGRIDPIDFLIHHWNITRDYTEKRYIYQTIKKNISTPEGIMTYCQELSETSELYAALFDMKHPFWSHFQESDRKQAEELSDFIRLIGSKPQLMVLLATTASNPAEIIPMLDMMAQFTFRYGKICNEPPSKIENVFSAAGHFIRENSNVTAREVFSKFFEKLYPNDETFVECFTTFRKKEAPLARYILANINDRMGGNIITNTLSNPDACTVEHILPQNHSEAWGNAPAGFADGTETYIWRLGNLTLLPKELNNELGNANFETKKAGYQGHCLKVSEDVCKYTEWTAQAIDQRQRKMAEIAKTIWYYPR